jgi:hypothetical protein
MTIPKWKDTEENSLERLDEISEQIRKARAMLFFIIGLMLVCPTASIIVGLLIVSNQ